MWETRTLAETRPSRNGSPAPPRATAELGGEQTYSGIHTYSERKRHQKLTKRIASYGGKKVALEQLRTALEAVAPTYFQVNMPGGRRRAYERVFSYELYHQMRLEFNNPNLFLHGEFGKPLNMINHLNRRNTVFPDIVVHQTDNIFHNILALEVKSSNTVAEREFRRDLRKLFFYSQICQPFWPGLQFQHAVYIVANYNVNNNQDIQQYWMQVPFNAGFPLSLWNRTRNGAGQMVTRYFVPTGESLHERWAEWRNHGEL